MSIELRPSLVHVDGHADHGDAVVDGLEESVVAHVRDEEERLGVRQDRLLRQERPHQDVRRQVPGDPEVCRMNEKIWGGFNCRVT